MKKAPFVRRGVAAGALSLLPSFAHAHPTDNGLMHDVAHFVFGGQHLFVIPAILVVVGVVGVVAFGAIRRLRSSAR